MNRTEKINPKDYDFISPVIERERMIEAVLKLRDKYKNVYQKKVCDYILKYLRA